MKERTTSSGFDMYFRSNLSRDQKRIEKKRHKTTTTHHKKTNAREYVEIKDDEMAEPSVTPIDKNRIWI